MSGHPLATAPRVGVLRRLAATLLEPPACVICGRGHASSGWLVDSFGRISGRCPGCVESPNAQHDQDGKPPIGAQPLT